MKVADIVKALQRYNIRARQYTRPPAGKDVFAITIDRSGHKEGTVVVNQGTALVDIHGSRKLRQAVVTVRERGRVVSRRVTGALLVHHHDKPSIRPDQEAINRRLIEGFPIVMPQGVKWKVTNTTCEKRKETPVNPERTLWDLTGTVTATVENKTVNHFLVGVDESANFISPLKRHVNSVEEAHRILRPTEVKKSALDKKQAVRQGEWFFVRCARKIAGMLNKLATDDSNKIKVMRLGDTTHTAKMAVVVDKKTYARGYVIDRRRGHHRSLWLDSWNQVFKNQEAEFKVSPLQQAAAKRRRATFD